MSSSEPNCSCARPALPPMTSGMVAVAGSGKSGTVFTVRQEEVPLPRHTKPRYSRTLPVAAGALEDRAQERFSAAPPSSRPRPTALISLAGPCQSSGSASGGTGRWPERADAAVDPDRRQPVDRDRVAAGGRGSSVVGPVGRLDQPAGPQLRAAFSSAAPLETVSAHLQEPSQRRTTTSTRHHSRAAGPRDSDGHEVAGMLGGPLPPEEGRTADVHGR
jgi:hypothetical protein